MTPPSPPSIRTPLAAAYAAQPAEFRACFGVTASVRKGETVFVWRNYFTGERGTLARVPEDEAVSVALAILAELKTLKAPERKRPERRKPAQSVMMRRRKTA